MAGMPLRSIFVFVAIGLIVAAHWVAFYTSIKISNASVAVACLGLGSIFAAIIEPIVMRRPHERLEILLGVLAVPGVALIAGGVPLEMRLGIAAGVVAALLSAIFTTLNKRFASSGDPFAVTCLEMTAGSGRRIFMGGQAGATFGLAYDSGNPNYGIFYTEASPDVVNISPNGSATDGSLRVLGNGQIEATGGNLYLTGNI